MPWISIDRRQFLAGAISTAAGLVFAERGVAEAPGKASRDGASAPLARRLAQYVDGLSYADIDARTLESLKLRLVDTFGSALAALDEPLIMTCFRIARAAGPGASTLIGTRHRVTAELAA